jgi:hypothetical protein
VHETIFPDRSGKLLGTLITVVRSPIVIVVSDHPDSDWASELPARAKTAAETLRVIILTWISKVEVLHSGAEVEANWNSAG